MVPGILEQMSSIFPSTSPVKAKMKRREIGKWSGHVNDQRKSAFFARLPAEIRNMVYKYIFAGSGDIASNIRSRNVDTSENDSSKPASVQIPPITAYPLSLLLTCRLASAEATLLAFHAHTFTLDQIETFHAFQLRTAFLPPPLSHAVSHVAVHIDVALDQHAHLGLFINNALLLFPSLKTVDTRTVPDPRTPLNAHIWGVVDRCDAHVPGWFKSEVESVMAGRSHIWQSGRKWEVSWPRVHFHPDVAPQYMGMLAGDACDGECVVELAQKDTGRVVRVRLVYLVDWGLVRKREEAGLVVVLQPGGEKQLPVEVVEGEGGVARGFMYDPGENYWKGLDQRRFKGVMGLNVPLGDAVGLMWRGSLLQVLLQKG